MTANMHLLSSMSAGQLGYVGVAIGELDWPVAGEQDGLGLIDSVVRRAPSTSWAIDVDGEVAGLVALTPYADSVGGLSTSTFITPVHRGSGLNTTVKHSIITAVRRGIPVDVFMSIDPANGRSLAAAAKLFGGRPPEFMHEPVRGRMAFVYNLADGVLGKDSVADEEMAGEFHRALAASRFVSPVSRA